MRIGPLKLKLQLLCGDGFAIGPGKADLLEAIARTGSISAAGREMGMSYRRAWLLVDEMNRSLVHRLVETRPGGGKGNGAQLSDTGRAVLAAFREMAAQAAHLAELPAYARLTALVRDETLPPAD